MRQSLLICIFSLYFNASTLAQHYAVHTNATDSFSVALVRLLNAAPGRFETLKGDSIRSTWLMGIDFKMNPAFPGAACSVVRYRDWDMNAYVEFRGYRDQKEQAKGMKMLTKLMENALGPQLYHSPSSGNEQFAMFSLQDSLGFFSSNIELMTGSSPANPYLLGPEKVPVNDEQPKWLFIILKISGGEPHYQYYIRKDVRSPDASLTQTVQQLIKYSLTDFDGLAKATNPVSLRGKKTDTVAINGYDVIVSYRGSHYTSTIKMPATNSSMQKEQQWDTLQEALKAAVGSGYVYFPYELNKRKYITYYASPSVQNSPTLRLVDANDGSGVMIIIESAIAHSTNRGLTKDDLD